MRLTHCLCKKFRIPGNLHTGKHQLPKIISPKQRKEYVKNLLIESENEMWLTRPWLKKKEEAFLPNGHRFSAANKNVFNDEKVDEVELKNYENKKYKIDMPNDVKVEDHWNYLKKDNKWDKEPEEERYRFQRYNDLINDISMPDQWPRPRERWSDWNRIEGLPCYGVKPNNKSQSD